MEKLKRKSFCNHYRAMAGNDTCLAGVPFSRFDGLTTSQMPCFLSATESVRCSCDLVQFPTPEEIAETERFMIERFERTSKARAVIVEFCGGPWKRGDGGVSGTLDCPCCGAVNALAFSRAGYNGHIHASCSTEDCVRWME